MERFELIQLGGAVYPFGLRLLFDLISHWNRFSIRCHTSFHSHAASFLIYFHDKTESAFALPLVVVFM